MSVDEQIQLLYFYLHIPKENIEIRRIDIIKEIQIIILNWDTCFSCRRRYAWRGHYRLIG